MLMDKLDECAKELLVVSFGVLALAAGVFVATPMAIKMGVLLFVVTLVGSAIFVLVKPTDDWSVAMILRRIVVFGLFIWATKLLSDYAAVLPPEQAAELVSATIIGTASVIILLLILILGELNLDSTRAIENMYKTVIALLAISVVLFARALFDSTGDWAWRTATPVAGIILGLLVESLGKQVKGCGPGCLTILLCFFLIALGSLTPDTWVLKIHVAIMLMVAALFVFFRANSWPNREEGW
ncbi:MAG: hypothetical protein BWY43_00001 [candidate division WS2 bacterium ADurb.Bin280]|uniref:Uncharacterized protein n=1 Tax=candidate division WS2 bacterium ADurb.Bin280 TaxID=1852829 RepID=A0A1V5SFZ7_9BACT|nr:MAG: hypothetical protein BWY43_00001 [candidate division WS2 bacterium ADurb.Bin280]